MPLEPTTLIFRGYNSGQKYFTNLDFPEIFGVPFPFQNATFYGEVEIYRGPISLPKRYPFMGNRSCDVASGFLTR